MRINLKRAVATVAVAATITGIAVTAPAIAAQAGPVAAQSAAQSDDIIERLKQIDGLTIVKEEPPPAPGMRFFYLTYTQPVDHNKPAKGTFEQRFSLLHRETSRPMVLHTTGYYLTQRAFRSEPTRLIDGNQISVEQRFFEPSRPQPADWSKLNIKQAATDHHRLVTALKPIYDQEWISTGASKGGMTSVYHRRFFPNDVDGVVAYVAPNDAVNNADGAYDDFFTKVGSTEACQDSLEALQKEALTRRGELVAMYEAFAAENGLHFDQVFKSADKAFEMTVLDTAWAFWQYSGEANCGTVPAATASTQEIWDFIHAVTDFSFYADEGILPYAPYFYQAATQLGWPSLKFKHLEGLMKYPGLYQANSSLPDELKSQHDARPMLDVDRWVKQQSSEMLFVYGGNDPWGAEPFVDSNEDSYTFTAPGANHGANIAALSTNDAAQATAALERWAGLTGAQARSLSVQHVDGLDDYDPALERTPALAP